MREWLGRETGTGLLSWVQKQRKVELHDCGTQTREHHGGVALL